MVEYIPSDWPNQKAKQSSAWLSAAQIEGPFTAMAKAMESVGKGISSLGGKGGGGGQQDDPEAVADAGTAYGKSQVSGSSDWTQPVSEVSGKSAAPIPAVQAGDDGTLQVNHSGGNAFHDDNQAPPAAASNVAAVRPAPGASGSDVPADGTSPLNPAAPPAGSTPVQPPGGGGSVAQRLFPPAPDISAFGRQGSGQGQGASPPYANPKSERVFTRAAKTAAIADIAPQIETKADLTRLRHPGDPEGFQQEWIAQRDEMLNGNPKKKTPGITDPGIRDAVGSMFGQHYNTQMRRINDDMDKKNASEHLSSGLDSLKTNNSKLESLALQGGIGINPKTGELWALPEAQQLLGEQDTLRSGLVNDHRLDYSAGRAKYETQEQGGKLFGQAVIGQVVRNYQNDQDLPAAKKALYGALYGAGSERYALSPEQRESIYNQGVRHITNADWRDKDAIKENASATDTRVKDMFNGKDGAKYSRQEYDSLIQRATGLGDRKLTADLVAQRPFLEHIDSLQGASAADRRNAYQQATALAGKAPDPTAGEHLINGLSQDARSFFVSRGGSGLSDEAHFGRLNPEFIGRSMGAIQMAEQATGSKVKFNSFGRSTEEQAKLYADYQSGSGGLAAPPGMSRHEKGNAVDIARGPALDWLHNNRDMIQKKFGVEFLTGGAYAKDPVHFQLSGAPNSSQSGTMAHIEGGAAGQAVTALAQRYGFDPADVRKYINIESGWNAHSQTSSYKGLLNLSDSEFNQYKTRPDANIFVPKDNLEAGLAKMRAEGDQFEARAGRKATGFDLYMVHQRGLGGYLNALKDPNGPAFMSMLNTGEGKSKGEGWAQKTVYLNPPSREFADRGRSATWTNKEFIDAWRKKFDGHSESNGSAATSPILDRQLGTKASPDLIHGGQQGSIMRQGGPTLQGSPPVAPGPAPSMGAAAPSTDAPQPPGMSFADSPKGFTRANDAMTQIYSKRAEGEADRLTKLADSGASIRHEDIANALQMAESGNNNSAADKMAGLMAAIDMKEGRQPGESFAQHKATIAANIANSTNSASSMMGMKAIELMNKQEEQLKKDPLSSGASEGLTPKLGSILDTPGPEFEKRAQSARVLQSKYPDLGAVSAIRSGEATQVAKLLTQGDPQEVGKFLDTASKSLGGPASETYRATMAQPEIKDALVAMAGSPDPKRMGVAMPVLDALWQQDPNAFHAVYGGTGSERLQLWQGLKGNFPDDIVAQKISAVDDPAVQKARIEVGKLAEKELGIAGGKAMNVQTIADKLYGGFGSGIPLVGSMISGASPPLDELTGMEMGNQFNETYKLRREQGLSADAAQQATLKSMQERWAPSALNNGRIMQMAPEAVTAPSGTPAGGTKYYPELPDRNGGSSRDWMKTQLDQALEGELGSRMDNDPETGAPVPMRNWRLHSIVPDKTTEAEVARGDVSKPPSYQIVVERNGALELVVGKSNKPMRWSWDPKKAKEDAAGDPGFQARIRRAQDTRFNTQNLPTGPM